MISLLGGGGEELITVSSFPIFGTFQINKKNLKNPSNMLKMKLQHL